MTEAKKTFYLAHSLNELKTIAWDLLSLCIRQEAADEWGNVNCITCPAKKHWKQMQGGHFIQGRYNSTLFDERGIHPQCWQCNCAKHSNPDAYRAFMRGKYGEEVIKELETLKYTTVQFSKPELIKMIDTYQQRLEKLTML